MIKEIKLSCHANMLIKSLRNKSEANNSDDPNWLPYADIIFETECVGLANDDTEIEIEKVNIPIQLRSIDGLIEALKDLKQELEK
jgi:hypothetical protein